MGVGSYTWWKHVLLVLGCLLILYIRLPVLYQSGNFIAEDSWVFFAGAHNSTVPGSLLQPYAGYFHLFPRLIAECCMWFGYAVQPYLYAGISAVVVSSVFGVFYFPNFRYLLSSDCMRAAVVLLLASSHFSQNLSLLLGVHWYLTFALLLFCSAKPPRSMMGRLGLYGVTFFACWSSPSVLAVVPYLVFRALRPMGAEHRHWALFGLLNIGVVFLFIFWMKIDADSRTGDFSAQDLFWAFEHVVLRGWLGATLIGEGLALRLGSIVGVLDLLGFSVLVGLLGVAFACWNQQENRHAREIGITLGFLFLSAFALLTLSLGRTLYIQETAASVLPKHTRYLSVPSLVLLVIFWCSLWWISEGRLKVLRRLLFILWVLQFSLLMLTASSANHWLRRFELFPWVDFVNAIESFDASGVNARVPRSLYVPSDVPYWGAVLVQHGGYTHLASGSLDEIPGTKTGHSVWEWTNGFGAFSELEHGKGTWIEHEYLGQVEYRGVDAGRAWFRDQSGASYFTAPLMYPKFWKIEGNVFQLLVPVSPTKSGVSD